ncbi:hypothetical protein EZV62_008884 [Acer yangbiense]|uniref:Vacuolar protein sorting-associated protein n=1 Tax=Acer yangbiense TaxID=1000413 RepID=A0A5C7IF43_9ROSI|nr:hypothetical protein EZV62_008884 [Acer yangbiense]
MLNGSQGLKGNGPSAGGHEGGEKKFLAQNKTGQMHNRGNSSRKEASIPDNVGDENQLNDIRKNPTFRSQFHERCAKVRVDPLASNKGFWAELLGMGVQIVDICLATRAHNGGLINLQELCKLLRQRRKSDRELVSEDDCLRAIKVHFFQVLGSGFEVISVGKKKLVRSVPTELNKDHNQILELAQAQGFVTVDEVERRLSWTSGRAIDALDTLLDEGLAMIDDGHRDGKRRYWFPCASSITSAVLADS